MLNIFPQARVQSKSSESGFARTALSLDGIQQASCRRLACQLIEKPMLAPQTPARVQ